MKIAVLIPVHGGACPGFVESLANMVAHTRGADVQTSILSLSCLTVARNALLGRALRAGADYALMLDSDHEFPPDALARLLAHKKMAVGINQPRRQLPIQPTAVRGRKLVETTPDSPALEEVDSTGLGMFLLDMAALPILQSHADKFGRALWPLFREEWPEPDVHIGEDRYFCGRLREAGIAIHIDHALSREVGHIAETVLRF